MFCKECGSRLLEDSRFCSRCGVELAGVGFDADNNNNDNVIVSHRDNRHIRYIDRHYDSYYADRDRGYSCDQRRGSSFGWGVLGFFFPLVGLILFCAWSSYRGNDARAAGMGAFLGVVVGVIVAACVIIVALIWARDYYDWWSSYMSSFVLR